MQGSQWAGGLGFPAIPMDGVIAAMAAMTVPMQQGFAAGKKLLMVFDFVSLVFILLICPQGSPCASGWMNFHGRGMNLL